MKNRFEDALAIQMGASNVSGITRTLVKAIDSAREDQVQAENDVACRLIAHQLAFLFAVDDVNENYEYLTEECNERALSAP